MKSATDVDVELDRAARLLSNGKFKRAESIYRSVLDQEPGNPRALASSTIVDAELGRISFEGAVVRARELIASNPENDRLPSTLISLLTRMKRKDVVATERRIYFERFPDSPFALQLWANGLQVDQTLKDRPETSVSAWEFYKRALASGPLSSPCFRAAALYAAKRADPKHAKDALVGSTFVEQLAIRTRSLGPKPLAASFVATIATAALLFNADFEASLCVQAIALAWGAWVIYANSIMCCKTCRNAWIVFVGVCATLGATADDRSTGYIVALVGVAVFAWAKLTGKLDFMKTISKEVSTGSDERESKDSSSESSSSMQTEVSGDRDTATAVNSKSNETLPAVRIIVMVVAAGFIVTVALLRALAGPTSQPISPHVVSPGGAHYIPLVDLGLSNALIDFQPLPHSEISKVHTTSKQALSVAEGTVGLQPGKGIIATISEGSFNIKSPQDGYSVTTAPDWQPAYLVVFSGPNINGPGSSEDFQDEVVVVNAKLDLEITSFLVA